MKNFISKLTERIVLLGNNPNIHNTTEKRYNEILPTRACIKLLKSDGLSELYEIIIPKPPRNINLPITGLKWKNKEYGFISVFSEYKDRFLKSTFILQLD